MYSLLIVSIILFVPLTGFTSDPVEELRSFSLFSNRSIDLQKLADGEILTERGTAMEFSRGITAQACFIMKATPSKVVQFYKMGEVINNDTLRIYIHSPIQSPPSDDDFKLLNLNSPKDTFKWLVSKTSSTKPEKSELFLNLSEAAQLAECMKKAGEPSVHASRCWKTILKERTLKFQLDGLTGALPYETGGYVTTPLLELQNILKEQPSISQQFASLISDTILAKHSTDLEIVPYYYWDLVDIDGHPSFNLGAIYIKAVGDSYQVLDLNYYSNSGIYVSATFRQVWPMTIQGKDVSLVWRGEEVSAPSLSELKGVERMAAGMVMIKELKKSIRFLQGEIVKTID